jgi:5-methylcytosine-specific restriction endonuclease McrA
MPEEVPTLDDPRYHSPRWKKTRQRIIRRDGRQCAVIPCSSDMTRPGMTRVDHITEVRDGADFWDESNLQVLCKPHHDAKTYRGQAERGGPESPNA